MKILISTDNLGESYTFSVDLATYLQNYGIDVVLAITGFSLTPQQKKDLQDFEYYFEEFKQEWMVNPWNDIREAGKWLMRIKKTVRPDILHLNSFALGGLQWNLPLIITMHSCILSRSQAVYNKSAVTENAKYRRMSQRGLRNADVVTSSTRAMLSYADKMYGPLKKSMVIPKGRSSYLYQTDVKEKYIFSTGQLWDDAKNLKLILKAAPEIGYPVYIAGDNNNLQINNLPKNVFFTGKLPFPQLVDWLANAFIFLLPAKYEPFGYPFLEAAFSKCALVGGDIPTLREIWQDTMLYVSGKKQLIKTVNGLMQDKELMYLYGQKAYEHAMENYRVEKMARHYFDLYKQVINPLKTSTFKPIQKTVQFKKEIRFLKMNTTDSLKSHSPYYQQ